MNFQTLVCKCGGTRILGAPCPECGAKAPSGEVNRYVVRRREGLSRVAAALEQSIISEPTSAGPITASRIAEHLQALLDAVGAFAETPTSDANVRSLSDAVLRVRQLRNDARGSASFRPSVGTGLAYAESTDRIGRVWELYRDALSSNTIGEAQAIAKSAQAVLDSAADPIEAAARTVKLANLLADDTVPIPERMFNALRQQFPELPLLEMREPAVRIAEADLSVAVGTNSGLSWLLLNPLASAMFDPVVFRSKVRVASDAVADGARVKQISAMDDSVRALAESHRLMVEASVAFVAVTRVESDDRTLARRLGKLVSEVYEAATPVFAWFRLLSTDREGSDDFSKTAAEDATRLASELQKGALAPVFNDAAKYLRHAPVHGRSLDYDPVARNFQIRLKSHSEVVPHDVFVDRVLAFLETVLASIWSLENAIERAGVEISYTDGDALYLGFTPLVLTAISLPVVGQLVVRDYGEEDGKWSFRVETDSDLVIPALVAAGNAVGIAEEVSVVASDDPPLEIYLSDSDAWMKAEGRGLPLALLATKASARLEGESLLKRSDVQYMLAGLGADMLGGDLQTIPHLRRLKSWSHERGWREEVELATEIIAVARGITSAELGPRLARLMSGLPLPAMPRSRAVRVIVPPAR